MNIQLVKAEKSDIDFIISAEQAVRKDAFITIWTKTQHHAGLKDENLIYLVIRTEGRAVGFFILAHDPDGISMEFKRIVITEQGQGFGQKAVTAMISYIFSSFEKTRIWLDVIEDNKRAQHVYEKIGFTFLKRLPTEDRFLKIYELNKNS